MCGINAIYDPKLVLTGRGALVSAMNAEMHYRGPDGEGLYTEGPLTIGMRRLSIIDLEGGGQPLFNEDGSVALVCNGEIYNHHELRAELEGRGHVFASGSDCETIVHLYEELGADCVQRLRGMFAFVLWDVRRQRLLAARDRLGIKPLYLVKREGFIALSSELKALVKVKLASTSLDYDALYQTLRHTYSLDARRTLARDVDRLPPGTILTADAQGVREKQYWRPIFGAGASPSSDDRISETFEDAVRIHLRSDVPVAVLLSAGLDSAAIAAVAACSSNKVTALSAGYSGNHESDEREGARVTARALGMDFQEVVLDADEYPALFDELTLACDEPPCDIAAIAQWALYRACGRLGYKVVLSGIGGDEIFFGYPVWNQVGELLAQRAACSQLGGSRWTKYLPARGRHQAWLRRRLGPAWPGAWSGMSASTVVSENEQVLDWLGANPRGVRSGRADEIVFSYERNAKAGPDSIYAFLASTYLPNNGFLLADRLGMGCSVEVRVPFSDHVLFDGVTSLPLSRRYERGRTKPLLRRVLSRRIPSEILDRPKQGFTPPTAFVKRIIREHADAILANAALSDWLDRDRLSLLLSSYLADESASLPVWARAGRRCSSLLSGAPHQHQLTWALYGMAAFVATQRTWRSHM